MTVAVVTGSAGLVGSATCKQLANEGYYVVGIDNFMRGEFFGTGCSTSESETALSCQLGNDYAGNFVDVRDRSSVKAIFSRFRESIQVVVHAAGQPSHDWSATNPAADFDINATGTLNLLEATRQFCPDAAFIFMSSNKVYGDTVNRLDFVELETRFEVASDQPLVGGVSEAMSIDRSLHSVFGVSKLAADLMVQEYGRNFGLKTVCFRAGTITGASHAASEWHGFLAFLVRTVVTGGTYHIFGYGGKQVRDVLHVSDLVAAFMQFIRNPRRGAVYNIGGGRRSNVSVLEALSAAQEMCSREAKWTLGEAARVGDHKWWITDNQLFLTDYPSWKPPGLVSDAIRDIYFATGEM